MLASDGLVEQSNGGRELFGVDRLLEAVSRSRGTSEDVASSLMAAVDAHGGVSPQQDDQALVVLQASGAST